MRAPPIPSSLKWLITKRTRLTGEITKAKKQESERLSQAMALIDKSLAAHQLLVKGNDDAVHHHQQHLQLLIQALAATDFLLREHEIPIDPNELPSVNGHTTERVGSYNQITRLIFESLARCKKDSLSTTEVAVYIATKWNKNVWDDDFPDFKYRIRKRLSHLVWEGRLERLHLPKTTVEGRWRLPKSLVAASQE